jgi:ribosomal protein S27AE
VLHTGHPRGINLTYPSTVCQGRACIACRRGDFRSGLLLHYLGDCATLHADEGEKHDRSITEKRVMELRAASPRTYTTRRRLRNQCAQCGETIFLPEWSEYLDRHRVRHLWECETCGYKFETLVSFPEPESAYR